MLRKNLSIALGLGLAMTAFQLTLALALLSTSHPSLSFRERYFRLCAWDCLWYEEIAAEGYHSVVPPVPQNPSLSNVAFFPGYPVLARLLYLGIGIHPKIALLGLAQFFSAVFWTALWVLLKQSRLPTWGCALMIFFVLAHPAAFFLISGFSESLFLAMMLLFLIAGSRIQTRGRLSRSYLLLALVSGFFLSTTRIVGLAIAGFPLFRQMLKKPLSIRACMIPLVTSGVSALGALFFFIYCWIQFGSFHLYLETQKIGWGIVPNYSALAHWGRFRYLTPMDGWAAKASGMLFFLCSLLEGINLYLAGWRSSGLRTRLPLYWIAFALFFLTLSGLESVAFRSMIRYSLPWVILLALCWIHLFRHLLRYFPRYLQSLLVLLVGVYSLWSFIFLQLPALVTYLNGKWFA